ncbi:6148_t:CDS:2 [Gigaspora margarita]|uniref:6148_t:CDS:1 n=1 Tax=Gigaspora margarita TaxID=4874 RepID=A0ABN7UJU4_GIGMA|nr:6148_t:CDS:2 [Gigaspora margarita]
MLHHDYEFIRLIEGYLEKICAKENELAKEQEIAADQATIEHVKGNVISITNPRKVVTRGRPKSASHEKNAITMQEKSIKKCGQYTCGFCKEPGHNIVTCLYKAKDIASPLVTSSLASLHSCQYYIIDVSIELEGVLGIFFAIHISVLQVSC